MKTELSIVLPYYKKLEWFELALAYNFQYFNKSNYEVVLCLDESSEKDNVVELLKLYKSLSARVFVNSNTHPWRNPAKAINVGIRQAKGSHVLIMSPESICLSDVPDILFQAVKPVKAAFSIGHVTFMPKHGFIGGDLEKFKTECEFTCFGSFCASRQLLSDVGGFDELNVTWGGDEDNLRQRLRIKGAFDIRRHDALIVHVEHDDRGTSTYRYVKTEEECRAIINPPECIVNTHTEWGTDFDTLYYSQ